MIFYVCSSPRAIFILCPCCDCFMMACIFVESAAGEGGVVLVVLVAAAAAAVVATVCARGVSYRLVRCL